MQRDRRSLLYRKVNTKAIGVHHHKGGQAKNDRNKKTGVSKSMSSSKNRGLDYTPLYKFLLSKIGKNWDDIYSEAVSRLDKDEAIFHLVKSKNHTQPWILCGESTYYSTLFVDEDNILRLIDSTFKNENLHPLCNCCTHTFNGVKFVNKYDPNKL